MLGSTVIILAVRLLEDSSSHNKATIQRWVPVVQIHTGSCATQILVLGFPQQKQQESRDVPRKEREKMGTGKELERTLFFVFPFLYFLTTFFPIFGENREKRVKKGVGWRKKGSKDVEQ